MLVGRKLSARGRLFTVLAVFVALFGFEGPAALATQIVDSPFNFTTTSASGTRLLTSTAPAILATDIGGSGGVVDSTTSATSQVVEAFAAGANFTVTAQICGPTGADSITATQAALVTTAGCDTGFGNQISGYDTVSGSYMTSIGGGDVTTTQTLTNAGSSTSPLLHGTTTTTSSSTMALPVTILNAGTSEASNQSYNGTYAVSSGLHIVRVDKQATWYGFWVTTLQP